MQANSSQPATADIRQFLTETFSDEELSTLCFDYFRDVYDDLASGMTKGQKIQMLIERCERRGVLPNLLTAIQRARPEQYKERFPQVEIQPEHPRLERDPRQVFISHAHQDANFAHRLAKDLQKHGWRLWIAPDSIRPGEKWGEAIDRGLDESGVFVVALTPAALQSRWVRDETYAAIELEKKSQVRFVPLYVKPCNVPHLWGTYQHISFSSSYASGLKELLAELEPPETVEPAPPPAQSVCVADETSRKQMPVPSHPSQPPAKRMMERLRFQFAAILSTHPLRNKLPFVAGAGILAVALVVVLVSAVMSGNKGIATPTPVPTHPAITSTGSIVAVLATDIPLSNATPEPTFTEVPKPATNIPTPTPTVLSSTPVPLPAAVISTTNVTQITQLVRWGKGKMTQVAWAPDGQTLALAGSLGIHFYEAAMLRETSFIETGSSGFAVGRWI